METTNLDIVYVVKNAIADEELRYSLRTLKNFPHRNVYFYGGCPSWATNIKHIPIRQSGTKWQNTSHMLECIVDNPEISDDFVLFNDDFFVLEPIKELGYYSEGKLKERVDRTWITRYMWEKPHYSRYGTLLKDTMEWLEENNYDTINYELHIPMIYNKKKLKKCLKLFPNGGWAARRSLYGNIYEIGGEDTSDVKIYSRTDFPKKGIKTFVSTTDDSFANGTVGIYIRKNFSEPSKYEK